ncbi:MAG: Crp/Fnr family transcriptional regulator [Amphritea sp.]|uniref:Crp/Fnr family transcriptional regulator n=1 Tax=Amphritea sp. TaxID=1872502 RepID=UPI001B4E9BC3|nr:Crp/Fnr family transcriptional regulator [Amphritea sp.]MBQ0783320.1 Crp/Fnr family transcriptional regulator [Amphritea sp.]
MITLPSGTNVSYHSLETVRQNVLLSALTDGQFYNLMKKAKFIELSDGDHLFMQGDEAKRFFIILQGNIKFFRLTSGGKETVINVFGEQDPVGEAAMFMAEKHYPASATAVKPAAVLSICCQDYLQLLHHSFESCMGILGSMASRLQRSIGDIEVLTQQSAVHRVAHFILSLIDERASDSVEVRLPATKQLIAARLAMQPETLSRVMRELQDKDLLGVQGRNLTILSVARLKKLIR